MTEIAEFKNVSSCEDEITNLKSELLEQVIDKAVENFYSTDKIMPYLPPDSFDFKNSDEQIKLKFQKISSLEKEKEFNLNLFSFKSHNVENLAIEQTKVPLESLCLLIDAIEPMSDFSFLEMSIQRDLVKKMTAQIVFEKWIEDNNHYFMHLTKPINWNDALTNDTYVFQYISHVDQQDSLKLSQLKPIDRNDAPTNNKCVSNQQDLLNLSQLKANAPLTKFVATLHRVKDVSYLPIVVVEEIACSNEEIIEKVSCEINAVRSKRLEYYRNKKIEAANESIQFYEKNPTKNRERSQYVEQTLKESYDLIKSLNDNILLHLTHKDEKEIKKIAISNIIATYCPNDNLFVFLSQEDDEEEIQTVKKTKWRKIN